MNNFSCAVRERHHVCKNFGGAIARFARSWLRPWQEVLSVATNGFIGCYGDVRGKDMESLRCRSEPRFMPQTPLAWHCRFRTSLFHHNALAKAAPAQHPH